MKIWAISDPHLAFDDPTKKMDLFGSKWENYTDKIKAHWLKLISPEDLVLIPGDISWAMTLEAASKDLQWLHSLPGTKVLLKGNHDYWWSSLNKVQLILPSSIHLIHNNAFHFDEIAIGGARMWDSPHFHFDEYIDWKGQSTKEKSYSAESEKIYKRELVRLEISLKELNPHAKVKIALTHYPPINALLEASDVSQLLEKYQIHKCIFGHLHNVKNGLTLFGERAGIEYILASCDYIDFRPVRIF